MSTGKLIPSSVATIEVLISIFTLHIGNEDLGIENTHIKTASGVSLDDTQQTLVGSVLDVNDSPRGSRFKSRKI